MLVTTASGTSELWVRLRTFPRPLPATGPCEAPQKTKILNVTPLAGFSLAGVERGHGMKTMLSALVV
ncbi:hypothetical protein E2C01_029493 [Portunus trituberculatus]|uniref:Uncharacterized protein n=1 Tax=Portunus trituberculatus TaxID=210409 RepID=A0A5B7ERZ6_PORTR|nr:hypothetical protein [Portunus trituberculatus]